MADRFQEPPFPRGELGDSYSDPNTVETAGNSQWEGREWIFDDKDYSNPGYATDRTNRFVTCRCVRNKTGGTLIQKRFVKFKTDGTTRGNYGGQVNGYGALGDAGGIVDEYLAAVVPDNSLFYIVVEGPTLVTTDGSGDTNIACGVFVIPATNGTVVEQDRTVVTATNVYNQMQSALGRTMEAVNANSTDVLISMRRMGA